MVSVSVLVSCHARSCSYQNRTQPNQPNKVQSKLPLQQQNNENSLPDQKLEQILCDFLEKTPLVFDSFQHLETAVLELHSLFKKYPQLAQRADELAFILDQNANPNNQHFDIRSSKSRQAQQSSSQLNVERAQDYYRSKFFRYALTRYLSNATDQTGAHEKNNTSFAAEILEFPQLLKTESVYELMSNNASSAGPHIQAEGLKKENILKQLVRRWMELQEIDGLDPEFRKKLLLNVIDDHLRGFELTFVGVQPQEGVASPQEAEVNAALFGAVWEMSPEELKQVREVTEDRGEAANKKRKWLIDRVNKLGGLITTGISSNKHQ